MLDLKLVQTQRTVSYCSHTMMGTFRERIPDGGAQWMAHASACHYRLFTHGRSQLLDDRTKRHGREKYERLYDQYDADQDRYKWEACRRAACPRCAEASSCRPATRRAPVQAQQHSELRVTQALGAA